MRWRRHFAAQDARRTVERQRQERMDAEEQARRDEAERERIAQHLARNGSYFPGDELEDLRPPPWEQISEDDPSQSGGDRRWYGFFRW
jgi:hypothetical protein